MHESSGKKGRQYAGSNTPATLNVNFKVKRPTKDAANTNVFLVEARIQTEAG